MKYMKVINSLLIVVGLLFPLFASAQQEIAEDSTDVFPESGDIPFPISQEVILAQGTWTGVNSHSNNDPGPRQITSNKICPSEMQPFLVVSLAGTGNPKGRLPNSIYNDWRLKTTGNPPFQSYSMVPIQVYWKLAFGEYASIDVSYVLFCQPS